jgi:hypothetical protein
MDCLEKIKLELEQKIYDDWEQKWASFGEYNIEKANRKAKFYQALASEITANTRLVISRDTVYRFDQANGGASSGSLYIFSKYLGYQSWEHYKAATNCQQPAFETTIDAPTEIKYKIPKKQLAYFGSTLLLGLILGWFYNNNKEKSAIEAVIYKANLCQFNTFKKLPILDTTSIDSFYVQKGNSRSSIITVLLGSLKGNRVIAQPRHNPSFYKILSTEILNMKDTSAIVQTSEHWFLKWYDFKAQRYSISYDVKNNQLYELVKQGDRWLILNDFFEGKATTIDY